MVKSYENVPSVTDVDEATLWQTTVTGMLVGTADIQFLRKQSNISVI